MVGNGVKVSQFVWKFHTSPEPNLEKIEPNGAKVSQFVKSEPKWANFKMGKSPDFKPVSDLNFPENEPSIFLAYTFQ